jgi:hypothetical protein
MYPVVAVVSHDHPHPPMAGATASVCSGAARAPSSWPFSLLLSVGCSGLQAAVAMAKPAKHIHFK